MYLMNIAEARAKLKERIKSRFAALPEVSQDVLLVMILVLACVASFGLGFLAGRDAGEQGSAAVVVAFPLVATTTGEVVASKSGSKYYLPWCAGADRISKQNKVWFESADAARAKGYSPAANCKGL